jgi:hypothetical protein
MVTLFHFRGAAISVGHYQPCLAMKLLHFLLYQLFQIMSVINDSGVGADVRYKNHDRACYKLVERIHD